MYTKNAEYNYKFIHFIPSNLAFTTLYYWRLETASAKTSGSHEILPYLRILGSKWASDSPTPSTSKKSRRVPAANPDEMVSKAKTLIFCRLEQMVTAEDLQSSLSASAQQFQVGLHGAVKALTKDSELLKSANATHSNEVKTLKVEIAKLGAISAEGWEKAKKLTEELKLAREDALTEFKEYCCSSGGS
nr:hypothetical protein Iba_chr05dCG11290 [Ipomoea batatas]